MINVISLFSGIGAFEEGMQLNNFEFEIVKWSEFDEQIAKSYSIIRNESLSKNLGDITQVDENNITNKKINLITYGFPCQPFSSAGQRKGFDDEKSGNLFFETMRVAKVLQPNVLIAENVKGLLSNNKGNTFKTVLNELEQLGYNNYYKVLNSKDFSVPQNRERIFIVSIRKDKDDMLFKFPTGDGDKVVVADILEKNAIRRKCKESLRPYLCKKYCGDVDKIERKHELIKLFDGCKEKYFSSSFLDNRIFSIKGLSPTLLTHNRTVFYELEGMLSPRECFKLQGFNPDYVDKLLKNGISRSKIEKMAGNSITVNVVQAILKNVYPYLIK